MHLHENNLFDLFLWPRNVVAQYPLHHVIYAATKFKVASANSLGEDTITRNEHIRTRMDSRMDRLSRTDFDSKFMHPFSPQEKVAIKCLVYE